MSLIHALTLGARVVPLNVRLLPGGAVLSQGTAPTYQAPAGSNHPVAVLLYDLSERTAYWPGLFIPSDYSPSVHQVAVTFRTTATAGTAAFSIGVKAYATSDPYDQALTFTALTPQTVDATAGDLTVATLTWSNPFTAGQHHVVALRRLNSGPDATLDVLGVTID